MPALGHVRISEPLNSPSPRLPVDSSRAPPRVAESVTPGPVRSWDDAKASDTRHFARWHGGLLERGVYWPPSQYEAAFIGAAHTDADIDATVKAAQESL